MKNLTSITFIIFAMALSMGNMVGCGIEWGMPTFSDIEDGDSTNPDSEDTLTADNTADVLPTDVPEEGVGQDVEEVDTPPPTCTNANECDDGNPCTDNLCDDDTGTCLNPDNTDPCDDGDACTDKDFCFEESCHAGQTVNCDDGKVCTDDWCDEDLGCAHETVVCSDGIETTMDWCDPNEGCLHKTVECDDMNPCNDQNPCTDEWCEEGLCIFEPNNGPPCDDGNACTLGTSCWEGACVGGILASCNDDNPCTDDSCDPQTGCVHTDNTWPCDDGDACTVGDVCFESFCEPGNMQDCNDEDPLTTDLCDPDTGECTHTCIPQCGDKECGDNGCEGSCGDCPQDYACSGGLCEFVPKCTDEQCNDGDACNGLETCNPQIGCQTGTSIVCNDNNPCTDDSCDSQIGCVFTNNTAPCDDGKVCTVDDVCGAGSCQPGNPLVCNDDNPCTDDSCDPTLGCVFTENVGPCTDGNACTIGDACFGGSCWSGDDELDCDDGNSCTDEVCDAIAGCMYESQTGTSCDDSDPCTVNDTCMDGACVPGDTLICNDDNPCTDDSCDSQAGCVHVDNTAPCDDGDACTVDDVCSDGVCNSGEVLDCEDGDSCTYNWCNPTLGCLYDVIDIDCDWVIEGDNCPETYNPQQEDVDGDGAGDACDEEKNCTIGSLPINFVNFHDCVTGCLLPNNKVACVYTNLPKKHSDCGLDNDGDGWNEAVGDCHDADALIFFGCWNQQNSPSSWITEEDGKKHPTNCNGWIVAQ